MTQVTQEFSALVLRKEKTRPQLDKPETPHNTRGFQPYKARDRPVSDAVQKVRKQYPSKLIKQCCGKGKPSAEVKYIVKTAAGADLPQ